MRVRLRAGTSSVIASGNATSACGRGPHPSLPPAMPRPPAGGDLIRHCLWQCHVRLRAGTSSVIASGNATFPIGEGRMVVITPLREFKCFWKEAIQMDKIYYNKSLKSRAQELRRDGTYHEDFLWYRFLRRHPVQFRRQKQFARYIVDFYCSSAKLVIELDGKQHETQDGILHDNVRTAYLTSLGLYVLRFSNEEIEHDFDAVCQTINHLLDQRLQTR